MQHRRHHGILRFQLDSDVYSADLFILYAVFYYRVGMVLRSENDGKSRSLCSSAIAAPEPEPCPRREPRAGGIGARSGSRVDASADARAPAFDLAVDAAL